MLHTICASFQFTLLRSLTDSDPVWSRKIRLGRSPVVGFVVRWLEIGGSRNDATFPTESTVPSDREKL